MNPIHLLIRVGKRFLMISYILILKYHIIFLSNTLNYGEKWPSQILTRPIFPQRIIIGQISIKSRFPLNKAYWLSNKVRRCGIQTGTFKDLKEKNSSSIMGFKCYDSCNKSEFFPLQNKKELIWLIFSFYIMELKVWKCEEQNRSKFLPLFQK